MKKGILYGISSSRYSAAKANGGNLVLTGIRYMQKKKKQLNKQVT
jgi:hypothetical protein